MTYLSYDNFKNFVLSKLESKLTEEVLLRDTVYDDNSTKIISYELESALAKLFKKEIDLIEQISLLLDDFFKHNNFTVYSILSRLDYNLKNFLDEIE